MIVRRRPRGRWFLIVAATAVAVFPPGSVSQTAPQSDAYAVRLIGTWIEALGGMDQLESLVAARFTLTTEMYDASSGRLRRIRPRYVTVDQGPGVLAARIERWEGDDFIVQMWDGRTAQAFANGLPLTSSDRDEQEVAYVAGEVNYWIRLPRKLKDPGVFLHYDGVDSSGRHTIRVTFGAQVGDHQDVYFYYFVDGRVWPVQVDYREEGTDHVEHTRGKTSVVWTVTTTWAPGSISMTEGGSSRSSGRTTSRPTPPWRPGSSRSWTDRAVDPSGANHAQGDEHGPVVAVP